jgi:hypothetical protein
VPDENSYLFKRGNPSPSYEELNSFSVKRNKGGEYILAQSYISLISFTLKAAQWCISSYFHE